MAKHNIFDMIADVKMIDTEKLIEKVIPLMNQESLDTFMVGWEQEQ